MKKYLIQFSIGLIILGISSLAAAEKIYTFDSDNQGWVGQTVTYVSPCDGCHYETPLPFEEAGWTSEYNVGQDGGGSIFQTATGWTKRPYAIGINDITPEDTFGDLTDQFMGTYIRSTGNWQGRNPSDTVYARWIIKSVSNDGTSNLWVSKAAYSIDLNDSAFGSGTNNDWVYRSIKMVESNFFQWPLYSNNGSFSDVVKNYTSFGLQISPTAFGDDNLLNFNGGDMTWGDNNTLLHYGATGTDGSGPATWGVDNFQVHATPEPGTMFLLGSGMCCLAWFGRRKTS